MLPQGGEVAEATSLPSVPRGKAGGRATGQTSTFNQERQLSRGCHVTTGDSSVALFLYSSEGGTYADNSKMKEKKFFCISGFNCEFRLSSQLHGQKRVLVFSQERDANQSSVATVCGTAKNLSHNQVRLEPEMAKIFIQTISILKQSRGKSPSREERKKKEEESTLLESQTMQLWTSVTW